MEYEDRRLAWVEKLYEDMYTGNGKENPSVTTRLDRLEQIVDDIKKLKWWLITAIGGLILNIVSSHVKF